MTKKKATIEKLRLKDWQNKILMLFFLLFVLFVSDTIKINTFSTSTTNAFNSPIGDFPITSTKIIEERFVDNETIELLGPTCYRGSIAYVNVTVLPHSNSSVRILTGAFATEFSPALTNVTLAPGESFAENYTYVVGVYNGIVFGCRCALPEGNATILWIYEVLYSAKPPGFIGIELWFISGLFLIVSIILTASSKRKKE